MAAVFADRSVTTFAGILGSLMAGRGVRAAEPDTFPWPRRGRCCSDAAAVRLIVDSAALKRNCRPFSRASMTRCS